MRHPHEKGTNVTHPELSVKMPRSTTGLFAVLVAVLALSLVLLAPSVASASFVRPFLGAITETTPGSSIAPGGLVADAKGDLWVGDFADGGL